MQKNRIKEVTSTLRNMILAGHLQPDQRVTEVSMAEKLGVSRTPVRLALQALEGEGLVEPNSNRGYVVRRITVLDVLSGFDVRGTLEGFACRSIAENGLSSSDDSALVECLEEGDHLFEIDEEPAEIVRRWSSINLRFHQIILKAAGSTPLFTAHEAVCRHPLVGPSSLAYLDTRIATKFRDLKASQADHHSIVDAMRKGEGSRAESWAREHMYKARENTAAYLRSRHSDLRTDSVVLPHMMAT